MGRHIEHIEISNFKSIRHQVIDGCRRINVFIGYPNVGKSNILEAISSLAFFNESRNANNRILSDFIRVETVPELFFDGNISEKATITVNERLDFAWKYDKQPGVTELTIGSLIPEEIGGATAQKEFQLVFDKTTLSQDSHKRLSDSYAAYQNTYSIPAVFKYIFRKDRPTRNKLGGRLLCPYGDNLMEVLLEDSNLRKEVSEYFSSYQMKLALDKSNNDLRILKHLSDDAIFLLPYSLVADTLQRLIFHKAAIASNQNAVLLFEEPEAHMFPPYISKFTSDIIYNKENNNQYFLNTHSPFVLNDFLEDARSELSVYVVGYKDGQTRINRLTDKQLHEVYQHGVDLFLNIEDYIANG